MIQDDAVDALAGAILDGTEIDWAAAESNAASESQREMIRDLKLIAAIAELHKSTVVAAPPGTGTWPPPDLEPVHTWGTLHILDQVGHGAYGEVYRAWDTRLNREVALKLLRAELSDNQARAALIIKEARLLARVRHPNVVTIHGAEQIDGRAGLWMEFIRGRTLAEMLEQGDAFSEAETIRVGVELCRAVTAVHDAGLIHRDIKSRNVMLADDGRVVLTDFGAGWQLSERQRSPARRHAWLHGPGAAVRRGAVDAERHLQHRSPALSSVDALVPGPGCRARRSQGRPRSWRAHRDSHGAARHLPETRRHHSAGHRAGARPPLRQRRGDGR